MEAAQARPSLHLSKCQIVGNLMSRLTYELDLEIPQPKTEWLVSMAIYHVLNTMPKVIIVYIHSLIFYPWISSSLSPMLSSQTQTERLEKAYNSATLTKYMPITSLEHIALEQ